MVDQLELVPRATGLALYLNRQEEQRVLVALVLDRADVQVELQVVAGGDIRLEVAKLEISIGGDIAVEEGDQRLVGAFQSEELRDSLKQGGWILGRQQLGQLLGQDPGQIRADPLYQVALCRMQRIHRKLPHLIGTR